MLSSQRALFDMPREVCFMNAAAYESGKPFWVKMGPLR